MGGMETCTKIRSWIRSSCRGNSLTKYLDNIICCIYNKNMGSITTETIARECIASRLRMVNRAVSRLYDRALRQYGVGISQLNILVAVSQFGQARQQDVCRTLFMERSTASRDVKRMLANGWLDVTVGQDARTSILKVSPKGKKLLEKVIPAWNSAQQQAITLFGKDQVASLDRIVSALRAEAAV